MNLRHRIALNMLSAVAVSLVISALIGGYLLWTHLAGEAQARVAQDLNAAKEFYNQRVQEIEASLRYTVLGERFSQAVADKDIGYLTPRLNAVRRNANIDLLCVTDADGRVTLRTHRPEVAGDSLADDPLVAAILKGQRVISGTTLIPIERLEKELPALAERVRSPVLPTAQAKPPRGGQLDSGMMIGSAAAVCGPDGSLVGIMWSGALLNRNNQLVDRVHNTVFRDEKYQGKLLGATTIFQDDVRISTTLLGRDGSPAIGTRASARVSDFVLAKGKDWIGPAWVVDERYLTSYAPLRDLNGKVVGMLGIGVLERRFRDAAWNMIGALALVMLGGLAAAVLLAWNLASSISRPVADLAAASIAVAQGDFSRTLPVESSDEIGSLAKTFNAMSQSLKERDELLKEQTRRQLTRSERLAAVGRLAAGVAHEINNPLTGVLTFAHMLLKNVPDNSQEKEDLETIVAAATRCRQIVRGLLDFSRRSESQRTLSDLNEVLSQALNLTRNQATVHRVAVVEEMDTTLSPLVIDRSQIQEVAVNLIVNAIDAMPDGGSLFIRTRSHTEEGKDWAEFEISDTGCGIPDDNLEKVFDPFFTTKEPGKGTGLGLAISYGIVTEHGGRIDIASEVGHGTTVTVRLPMIREGENAKPAGMSTGSSP